MALRGLHTFLEVGSFKGHYRLTFEMELFPHAMAVLTQCSGSKDGSFQG